MHEYRRFIQAELDARGWKPADLVRESGTLRRQLVWSILHDERPHIGQMPDESTLEAIARGFSIPVERVRLAAARSLSGYVDDGAPLTTDLGDVSIDALLAEIKRRVERGQGHALETAEESSAPPEGDEAQEVSDRPEVGDLAGRPLKPGGVVIPSKRARSQRPK